MKGIYSIRHLASGNCYVGSSANIERRWKEHKHRIRVNTHPAKHLMNAFHKYGSDAFTFEILEECDQFDDITRVARENYWISKLNPIFNVAPVAGSLLGFKRPKETKEKMAQAQKVRYQKSPSTLRGVKRPPEVCAAIGAGHKGKKFSAEHIANMSAGLKGRISPRKGVTLSDETKAKISIGKKGFVRAAEISAAVAVKNTGRKRTEEQRARMCTAQKGRTFSDETKVRMSLAALAYQARKREAQSLAL